MGRLSVHSHSQGDALGYEIAGLSARLCFAQNVEEVGGRRGLAELDELQRIKLKMLEVRRLEGRG